MNLQQVHLRINDAATGKPTPVRLRITDAAGTYYAPFGRLTEFATGVNQDVGGNVQIGAKKWAYIDGACEILLPPGQLHIEITKGPEYKPIDEDITLLAGKMSLRFTIERWCDMRKEGWYSGDTRVHFLSPDAALLEGQAEDLAVVNLLAKETTIADASGGLRRAVPNILSFSGQSFARTADGCGVAVNTENFHPELGSLGLLHCHRVVYPLTFDSDEWTLHDWCGQCHRKKGLVIWTDVLRQAGDLRYPEALANLVLGEIDAFEVTSSIDSPFAWILEYYRLAESELIVPLVGASAKMSNALPAPSMRTFAHLPHGEFTYSNWIEAVRAGRTFITNGPLLHFTINGAVPGSTLMIAPEQRELTLHAEAKNWLPFEKLEITFNGTTIADAKPTHSSHHHATIDLNWRADESGWLAILCSGADGYAHSSAIVVRLTNAPRWAADHYTNKWLTELGRVLLWAKEKQRARLCDVLEEARTALAKKLS